MDAVRALLVVLMVVSSTSVDNLAAIVISVQLAVILERTKK